MSRKSVPRDEAGDDEIVVVCIKVLAMPHAPLPGASRIPCGECGQPVWLSPATAAHVAGKPHRIACADCVARARVDDPDGEVMAPTPAQIAEMVSADPSLTPARIRRKFPASNPARRKAALEELLRRTRARKRNDN